MNVHYETRENDWQDAVFFPLTLNLACCPLSKRGGVRKERCLDRSFQLQNTPSLSLRYWSLNWAFTSDTKRDAASWFPPAKTFSFLFQRWLHVYTVAAVPWSRAATGVRRRLTFNSHVTRPPDVCQSMKFCCCTFLLDLLSARTRNGRSSNVGHRFDRRTNLFTHTSRPFLP